MSIRNRVVATGLAATLVFGAYAPMAYATPQSQLAEASQKLEAYGDELTKLQDDLAAKTTELENTSYLIGEKEAEIEVKKEELKAAKRVLWKRMRSTYKSGNTTLLGVILGADSVDDIISRIYYMDKVASSDANAISTVRQLEKQLVDEKDDLEQTKSSQQQAVDDLQGEVESYETKVAEARAYYEALDAQVQQQLAEQQAAEENARIQAVMEATEQTQVNEGAATQQPESEGGNTEQGNASNGQSNASSSSSSSKSSEQSSSGNSVAGGGGLGTAYAAIGSPYVYGAAGPNAFDCSGLVCYSYGYGRGRTTYDMISSLKSTGDWKTNMSDLNVGDLVFTSEGHVGIYTGNGTMVHAPTPGKSVCETTVWSFIGGGSY